MQSRRPAAKPFGSRSGRVAARTQLTAHRPSRWSAFSNAIPNACPQGRGPREVHFSIPVLRNEVIAPNCPADSAQTSDRTPRKNETAMSFTLSWGRRGKQPRRRLATRPTPEANFRKKAFSDGPPPSCFLRSELRYQPLSLCGRTQTSECRQVSCKSRLFQPGSAGAVPDDV